MARSLPPPAEGGLPPGDGDDANNAFFILVQNIGFLPIRGVAGLLYQHWLLANKGLASDIIVKNIGFQPIARAFRFFAKHWLPRQ